MYVLFVGQLTVRKAVAPLVTAATPVELSILNYSLQFTIMVADRPSKLSETILIIPETTGPCSTV